MSQKTPLISDVPPAETRTWNEIWSFVLTQPSVGTFQEILQDPKASTRRAYLWVFFGTLAGSAISVLINSLFSEYTTPAPAAPSESTSIFIPTLLALLVGTPIISLIALFLFVDWVLLNQYLARKLGGTGAAKQLLWATAAFVAPLTLGATALSAITAINCTAVLFALYGLGLNWIALKTVNKLSWGKALGVDLIASFVFLIFVALILILVAPAFVRPAA